jgi:chromosome segregation ATPase
LKHFFKLKMENKPSTQNSNRNMQNSQNSIYNNNSDFGSLSHLNQTGIFKQQVPQNNKTIPQFNYNYSTTSQLSFNPQNNLSNLQVLNSHVLNNQINNTSIEIINSSIINPLTKQLEILKYKIKSQEEEHAKDLEELQDKHETILRKRDLEIKAYVNNLLSQLSDCSKSNSSLITENKKLKDTNNDLNMKIKNRDKAGEDGNYESNLKLIKEQGESRMKELENNFNILIKNLSFQTFVGSNLQNNNQGENFNSNIEEQMFIYENKIKLIYEEIYLKDKQIINLEQKLQAMKEDNNFLKIKFIKEKELLTEKLVEIESKSDELSEVKIIEDEIFILQQKLESQLELATKNFHEVLDKLVLENEKLKSINYKLKQENINLSLDYESATKEIQFFKSKFENCNEKFHDSYANYELNIQKIQVLEKENEILKERLESFNSKVGDFVSSALSEKEIRKELETQYRELIDNLQLTIDRCNNETVFLKEQISSYNQKYEALKNESENKKYVLNDLNQELSKLRKSSTDLNAQNKELENFLVSERKKLYEYESKNMILNNEVEELRTLKKGYDELRLKNESLSNETETYRKNLSLIESKMEASRSDHILEVNKLKNQIMELSKFDGKLEKSKPTN